MGSIKRYEQRRNGAESLSSQQRDELEHAILRAQRDGIVILARGTRKRDGARVGGVTRKSIPDYRLHQVVEVGGRLICDCPSRVICKHRGLVHQALVAEAAAAAASQPRPAHETAPLARSNAAISMWK